jgi:hypothetical protein
MGQWRAAGVAITYSDACSSFHQWPARVLRNQSSALHRMVDSHRQSPTVLPNFWSVARAESCPHGAKALPHPRCFPDRFLDSQGDFLGASGKVVTPGLYTSCVAGSELARGVLCVMGMSRHRFGLRGLTVAALLLIGLGWGRSAQAQVGIRSGISQVSLLARSTPRASIETDNPSFALRLTVNTGYSVVVRGLRPAGPGSRIWVRSAEGVFQEITDGSAVTVAHDGAGRVDLEQVQYRIESLEPPPAGTLPLYCELRIAPTL